MDRDARVASSRSRPQLRTYSKRATPRDDCEPPAKKQKTHDIAKPTATRVPKAASSTKPEPSCAKNPKSKRPELPAPRSLEPAKKGTIMSYFKVTSPSSGSATPCEVSSEAVNPPSTPPSSPPSLSTHDRKRRRRLTTKPSYQTTPELESERDASEPAAEDESKEKPGATTVVLSEVATQKLNQQDKSEESRLEAEKRGTTKKMAKPKKTATVQTTIVLSLNETGFVECQECNMLYNSLHAKDVKLHARRHAAVLRKAKLGEQEDD
ncbi:hypothetical protein PG994_012451 [Apiospora phragmitis]|uniref:N-acetyltransferase ESCO zinc-finger domain-containing protein n=1 Tax=Apiospora phragmitis TaxID=2905665 RepID=A0ABR1TXY6_9PEZI